MSELTRQHLFSFWELIDELLNLLLFGLIGLEVIALSLSVNQMLPGLIAIPIVLLARWVSVGVPVMAMSRFRVFTPNTIKIMTWGGLRGGISVALALSLPHDARTRNHCRGYLCGGDFQHSGAGADHGAVGASLEPWCHARAARQKS